MPEYLSPGVFIEEIPGRLKALEGVGTSTAAFVGPALRGTVPGFPLPFTTSGGFVLNPDPAPVFVTSFAEFTRQFGFALPLPNDVPSDPDYGYLAYAVRSFFGNGGRRCYISRIVDQRPDPSEPTLRFAKRGTHRVAQGRVYRLQRSLRKDDQVVALVSSRGLDSGAAIQFRRRSDNGIAAESPATPASLTGSKATPLALHDGDLFQVRVTAGGPPTVFTAAPIHATPMRAMSATAGPFIIAPGTTFDIQLGAGPIQTATFNAADLAAAPNATADEVINVLSRDLAGVHVYKVTTAGPDLGKVVIDTDHRGTAAALAIPSAALIGLSSPAHPGGPPDNVSNVDHVTAAEINALFTAAPFTVTAGATGTLVITSTTPGSGVTLEAPLGPPPDAAMRDRFGLGTVTSTAGGDASPSFSIASYSTVGGTITLNNAVPIDLDASEVYVRSGAAPTAGAGPKFHARSPGTWSSGVSISISPADRPPVRVTAAVSNVAADTVEVQNPSSFYVGAIVEIDHDAAVRSYHEIKAITGRVLTLGNAVGTAIADPTKSFVRVVEIDVVVTDDTGAAPVEIYRGLTWNQSANADLRRHYANVINARSRLVYAQPPGIGGLATVTSEGADLTSQPTTSNGFPERFPDPFAAVAGDDRPGSDGLPAKNGPGDAAYIGDDNGPGLRSGIESLKDLTDVRIILAPGRTSQSVQLALISQCELLRYRFAILDAPQDAAVISTILSHRNLYDTSFAAYYSPWLGVNLDGQLRYLPPSGYLAGVYARVDNSRGVWKAPANEPVFNIIDLKTNFTTGEQDILNPRGVNLIRRFEEGGIRVWGARTVSGDPELKYINVRRTLIFLEATIDRGTQWVVFEPNTPDTWSRVTATIKGFLETQWRAGALFGRSAEQAFFVRCDETTMSEDDIQNGRLICHIGVAIVRPAEFVIFRIEQITGFAKQ
jgi:phage tail sheath protein FI